MLDLQAEPSVTELLVRASAGDASAMADIFPLIYEDLRRIARRQLQREADGYTLSATALVHEAYINLVGQRPVRFEGRAHFMAIAATAMRRILIDRARSFRSQKRGGAWKRVALDAVQLATEERAAMLIALDDALERLKELDARQAQVVECRFFGGMTEEETAEALGVSVRTVKRDWAKAKSWLYVEVFADDPAGNALGS